MSIINGFNAIPNNIIDAVGKYNKTVVTKGQVSSDGVTKNGNAFPTEWTVVSTTELSSTEGIILSASTSNQVLSSYRLKYAMDGNGSNTNCWNSVAASATGAYTEWIKIKMANPIKITKMFMRVGATNLSSSMTATIQGSNNDSTWTDLYTISASQTAMTEVVLNNTNYYLYYRIYFTTQNASKDSSVFTVYEWQTSEYMTQEDQYINNLSLPFSSYETGKIINIEASSYEDITSFDNPYLNINNLGAKKINGTIKSDSNYSLIYNGNDWDISSTTIFTIGSFSNSSTATINLGFSPDLVIVYHLQNNQNYVAVSENRAEYYHVPRILTKIYSNGNSYITDDGFVFYSSLLSGSYGIAYYIAIKY